MSEETKKTAEAPEQEAKETEAAPQEENKRQSKKKDKKE